MIIFKNVTKSFDGKKVLENFSATLPEQGIVLITGPSGSGKTTLSRLILGLSQPDSGEVILKADKISVVFQEDRLVPSLSALENVALVSNTASAAKRLQSLSLGDSLTLLPAQLSGGMKRRVAVARALEFGGEVLLLDEAFSGLEDALAKEILDKICDEYKDRLIVAITHRPELFADLSYIEIKLGGNI